MTAFSPARSRSPIQVARLCSQGNRCSSVRAWPARISSTLAGSWKMSPSANAQPVRATSSAAMVLLPPPETPITTIVVVAAAIASSSCVRDPDSTGWQSGRPHRGCLGACPAAGGVRLGGGGRETLDGTRQLVFRQGEGQPQEPVVGAAQRKAGAGRHAYTVVPCCLSQPGAARTGPKVDPGDQAAGGSGKGPAGSMCGERGTERGLPRPQHPPPLAQQVVEPRQHLVGHQLLEHRRAGVEAPPARGPPAGPGRGGAPPAPPEPRP